MSRWPWDDDPARWEEIKIILAIIVVLFILAAGFATVQAPPKW